MFGAFVHLSYRCATTLDKLPLPGVKFYAMLEQAPSYTQKGFFLMSRISVVALLIAGIGAVAGCGGGSSTPPPVITNPPSITPASAAVPIGGTQQFTANNFSGTVSWT